MTDRKTKKSYYKERENVTWKIRCPVISAPHSPPSPEFLTNQEEVELRAKIKALGLEVSEVPSKPSNKHLDELEMAKELDMLSAKLDDVGEMISSAMAADLLVQSLLSSTAELWSPVITATSSESQSFKMPLNDNTGEINGKNITDS